MVKQTNKELIQQARWYLNYCLDPMCSTDEINYQVGYKLFIERVIVELSKSENKPIICDICGHISTNKLL